MMLDQGRDDPMGGNDPAPGTAMIGSKGSNVLLVNHI